MQELKPIKEGKVREIYDNGDSLIMVATDRISCFDVILNNDSHQKRHCSDPDVQILVRSHTGYPAEPYDLCRCKGNAGILPVSRNSMARSMMCRKLNMLPIECIVRGYITGSGWASYKENGTVMWYQTAGRFKGIRQTA